MMEEYICKIATLEGIELHDFTVKYYMSCNKKISNQN